MVFRSLYEECLIRFVTEELDELIDINKNDFSNGVYKFKTNYSDSTFYLNKVNSSFDESLHMLIHRIMYVEKKHVVGSNDPDEDLDCYYRMFIDSDYINQLTGIENAVGTSSIYLVGMQAFKTPIVITDDTASMDVAFTSSTGMSVFDVNANGGDDVYVATSPFALKMTTK